MKCAICGKEAIYVRPYDNLTLCLPHFNNQMEKRVRTTITKYKLLGREDKIAVGLSGGKDSVALLHLLSKIEQDYPDTEIVAITIDEGIENYREEGLSLAKKHAQKLNLEHHIFSFEDDFGYSLDEIIDVLGERGKERAYGACSYCGILRRKLLNYGAKKIGATVLATGHNLEDEAETVLLNILRGDIIRLARIDPVPKKMNDSLIPRIKPFRLTPQAEIVLYCYINDLEYQEIPCPYAVEAYRGNIRDFVVNTQNEQPMLSYNIVGSHDKLLALLKDVKMEKSMKECACGDVTAGTQCKACWLKNKVEKIKSIKNETNENRV